MNYIERSTSWHRRIDRQRRQRQVEASLLFLLVLMGVLVILTTVY